MTYDLGMVLRVTVPLILTALSSTIMMVVDRYIVGLFSVLSMNAISIVGSYLVIPGLFFLEIAAISTVYVGQFNGNQQFDKIGNAVWQMIYFSLLVGLVCIPFLINPRLYSFLPAQYETEGLPYQQIMTLNVFLGTFYSAVAGFFIGRGKTAIVTCVVVLSNILNFVLDILLIFGVKDIIPMMGVSGAAIATDISNLVGCIILTTIFFLPKNRIQYETTKRSFNKDIFLGCLKIGGPAAVDRVFNLTAWSMIFILLGNVSDDLATLESVTVSVYLLFCCYSEGLHKGAASIASNLIGQDRVGKIHAVLKTYLKINIGFCALISIPLVFKQDILFYFLEQMNGSIQHLHDEFSFIFYVLFVIIFFDGIFWIIYGIFTAGGDTLWAAVMNTIFVWVLITLPTYVMYVTKTLNSVKELNSLSALNSFLLAIVLYIRYKNGKWKKKCKIV